MLPLKPQPCFNTIASGERSLCSDADASPSARLEFAMRSATLARTCTIAVLCCLVLITIGVLGFGTLIATNTAPRFSAEVWLGNQASLEVHNGSACPRDMPTPVCYWSGLSYRRQFRIVYRGLSYQRALLVIRLPDDGR